MALLDLLNSAWVQRWGWVLVHFLWQGLVVALLLGVFLRWAARWRPQARYAVAGGAMLLLVAAPIVTFALLPRWTEPPAPSLTPIFRDDSNVAVGLRLDFGAAADLDQLRPGDFSVVEHKHSHDISSLFDLRRGADGRGVELVFRQEMGDFGTGNAVTITPSRPVRLAGGRVIDGKLTLTCDTDRASPAPAPAPSPSPAPGLRGWSQSMAARLEPILPHAVGTWAVGVLGFSVWHLGGWMRVRRLRQASRPLGDGRPDTGWLSALASLSRSMGLGRPVRLLEVAEWAAGPVVVGVFRPAVLIPLAVLNGLNCAQAQAILAHELAHIRRHDYLVNLLQTLAETLLFYHPCVWWISARMRRERELCCDDAAAGASGARSYAAALAALAEIAIASSNAGVGRAGARLAPGAGHRLLRRIQRLLGARKAAPRRGSSALIAAVGGVGLAALAMLYACRAGTAESTNSPLTSSTRPAGRPHVVESTPAAGQLDVDPALQEMKVVFDRPMRPGGYSFVGGGESFPAIGQPRWVDERTIALPVTLKAGHGYWMSINSDRFTEFRAADGTPAEAYPITFATRPTPGGKALARPKVVHTVPGDGQAVAPGLAELRVEFDQPMDAQAGYSWVQMRGDFPHSRGDCKWLDDRTAILPVFVDAGRQYSISINSSSFQNFRGVNGLSAEPYPFTFRVAGIGATQPATSPAGTQPTTREAALRPLPGSYMPVEELVSKGGGVLVANLVSVRCPDPGPRGAGDYLSRWKVVQTMRGRYAGEERMTFRLQSLPEAMCERVPEPGKTYIVVTYDVNDCQIACIFDYTERKLEEVRAVVSQPATQPARARLSDGTEIELRQIGTNPPLSSWWGPNGEVSSDSGIYPGGTDHGGIYPGGVVPRSTLRTPVRQLPGEVWPPQKGQRAYNIIYQITNSPNGDDEQAVRIEVPPSAGPSMVYGRSGMGTNLVTVDADALTTSFVLGVTTGPWQAVLSGNPGDPLEAKHERGDVRITSEAEASGRLHATVELSDAWKDVNWRVVAVDSRGRVNPLQQRSVQGMAGKHVRLELLSDPLRVSEMSSLRFEFRPYERVEFRNVSLRPRGMTQVKAVLLAGHSPASSQPATQPGARPVALDERQRMVEVWTDRQFRSYFDARTFEGWTQEERARLEARCIDALRGPQNREYFEAINTLAALRSAKGLPALRQLAFERRDKNNRDRWMAIRALGLMGDRSVVPELIHLVYHGNVNTRWWAQISLVRLTGKNFGSDWQAWGRWWNESGGQPPFDPQIIRWWNGQAEPDKLKQVLEESDLKFFESLQKNAPATQPAPDPAE